MNLTLEDIRARCHEDGDTCWMWTGAFNEHQCVITIRDEEGKRRTMPVRRRVAQLLGLPIDGKLVSCSCGYKRCVSPGCIALMSRKQVQVVMGKKLRGKYRPALSHKLATKARAHSEMTMELAQSIRASPLSGVALSKIINVSEQSISRIRRNQRWVEHQQSPFAGLGAR